MKIEVNVYEDNEGRFSSVKPDSSSDNLRKAMDDYTFIGTQTIEVTPPTKEVVREVKIKTLYPFRDGTAQIIPVIPVDENGYDYKLTYKVKEPA